MKKYYVLILVVMLICCAKPPVDSVALKVLYHPETSYNYSTEQTLKTVITYSGKEKSLSELKKRGIKNPTIFDKKSTTEALIKTGKLDKDDNDFPIKVEYVSEITNNGIKAEPVNATFHGKCAVDSIPVFDVAAANGLDKSSKMILLESWQKSFNQLPFSSQKLKAGEELVTRTPSSIPMEGSEIEMIVTSTYKLISIKNGMADFDISQQYALNPKLMDNSFQGTVKGQGHLVYDMEHSIVMNYTLDTEMALTKKLDSFEFQLKTNSHMVQKTSIQGPKGAMIEK
jgi:hypothetical protein